MPTTYKNNVVSLFGQRQPKQAPQTLLSSAELLAKLRKEMTQYGHEKEKSDYESAMEVFERPIREEYIKLVTTNGLFAQPPQQQTATTQAAENNETQQQTPSSTAPAA